MFAEKGLTDGWCNIILSIANKIFLTNIPTMIKDYVDILPSSSFFHMNTTRSSQPILDCDKKRFNVQTLSGTSLSLLKQTKSILDTNICLCEPYAKWLNALGLFYSFSSQILCLECHLVARCMITFLRFDYTTNHTFFRLYR